MSVRKITRKYLYERVWTEPMTRLANAYGMSDVGLAKLCTRFEIPRPPRGYWAKKEFGKEPPKRPLPHPEKDFEIDLRIRLKANSGHLPCGIESTRSRYRSDQTNHPSGSPKASAEPTYSSVGRTNSCRVPAPMTPASLSSRERLSSQFTSRSRASTGPCDSWMHC